MDFQVFLYLSQKVKLESLWGRVSQFYETKHAKKYNNSTDAENTNIWGFVAELQKQRGLFTKLHTSKDGAAKNTN